MLIDTIALDLEGTLIANAVSQIHLRRGLPFQVEIPKEITEPFTAAVHHT